MAKEEWENLAVFKKAKEIHKLVEVIINLIDKINEDEDDFEKQLLKDYANYMYENAMIIPAKIAGASSENMLYDVRMENAVIIRKSAREILTQTSGLKMSGFKHTDYLELIRNEIEEFRVLFAEWVKTFDQWNYIIDRWGVFNPLGVNYDDHDPDDDL